jgi:hypothetical protein
MIYDLHDLNADTIPGTSLQTLITGDKAMRRQRVGTQRSSLQEADSHRRTEDVRLDSQQARSSCTTSRQVAAYTAADA